jgi:hypothetical protein
MRLARLLRRCRWPRCDSSPRARDAVVAPLEADDALGALRAADADLVGGAGEGGDDDVVLAELGARNLEEERLPTWWTLKTPFLVTARGW